MNREIFYEKNLKPAKKGGLVLYYIIFLKIGSQFFTGFSIDKIK